MRVGQLDLPDEVVVMLARLLLPAIEAVLDQLYQLAKHAISMLANQLPATEDVAS